MNKYKTMADFSGEGFIPILSANVTAIPPFFSIILFVIWLGGTTSSYFAILKLTGKKRFFHALTSMSFICFLASLLVIGMNTSTMEFLSGYWVGFYILMTLISYYLLSNYK